MEKVQWNFKKWTEPSKKKKIIHPPLYLNDKQSPQDNGVQVAVL